MYLNKTAIKLYVDTLLTREVMKRVSTLVPNELVCLTKAGAPYKLLWVETVIVALDGRIYVKLY